MKGYWMLLAIGACFAVCSASNMSLVGIACFLGIAARVVQAEAHRTADPDKSRTAAVMRGDKVVESRPS
jgi:hypothetical protein